MKNPWEEINLEDYENHMKLDSVKQLQTLNFIMKAQFGEYPVATAMVLGVAGGNGLEHVDYGKYSTVYGVDINENYLEAVATRYAEKVGFGALKLLKANLFSESEKLPQAELLIANLLIEYIGYDSLRTVERHTREVNMNSVTYRRLTEEDLAIFIEMRITQLREEGAKDDIDLRPALNDYYRRHLNDGTFVSWLALDGEKIVGTSGMSFVEKPPYFGCPSGKIGLISSMYTDPSYRRRGIAKDLLTKVMDDARKYGCGAIQITASDMGVKLYTACGFVHNGNFMQYNL